MSNRHTVAVKNFKIPHNVHEVQRFLGLVNYFRKFIKDYAIIAKPLHNLLRKAVDYNFDNECMEAFQKIKVELTSFPVLRLYDPKARTELHTDVSSQDLGAILLQQQHNDTRGPVAYFSQATNQAENKYHSFELEMLAIVRAVERFHFYLCGIDIVIVTDCNALVHAVNKASLNPRIARWTFTLQNYSFKLTHRPDKRMAHVDALSRCVAYIDAMPLEKKLEYRQLADPKIEKISQNLELGHDSNQFAPIEGLVYKKIDSHFKFIIPNSMINVIRAHHDELAHCGPEKTVKSIQKTYWFLTMRKRVHEHVENCITCLIANSSLHSREGEIQMTLQSLH